MKKTSNSSAIAKYKVTVTHSNQQESEAVRHMCSQVLAKIAVDVATRKKLAEFLRLRRQELGLTQKQAAKLVEPRIDAGQVCNFEATGRWSLVTITRYANALGCQIPENLMPSAETKTRKALGKVKIRSVKLSRFLTERRRELGLSRVDVANALGTHWNPIRKWEGAQQPIPDVYLDAWAEVLKCNQVDLRAIVDAPDDRVARIVMLKRVDSEYLDHLLELGNAPDSSRTVKDGCKFLYSFLLMKALKQHSTNPHLFTK